MTRFPTRVIVALSAQTRPTGGAALDDMAFFDAVVTALH